MAVTVDLLLAHASRWKEELLLLRDIVRQTPLKEEVKWGQPCYTLDGRNVLILHGFKEYCAILFFKGALMKDPKNILIQQTENVQSSRQIRFHQSNDIVRMTPVLKKYIQEAIAIEKAGLKITPKKSSEYKIPAEFQLQLDQSDALRSAFRRLTPGRQRAYLLYFGSAKQSQTRTARIEKHIPHILNGKGLNDA